MYAPITGVIVAQNVTNAAAAGVTYSGTSTLFTIADLSVVWILCDVYENDIPKIHLGQEALIHVNAYPDGTLTGHITDIGPVLDPNIRTAKVRIEIRNPGTLKLGMFVTATFESRTKQVFAVVPSTAILHLHDRDWVFIPAGGKQFKRVEVNAGDMLPGNNQQILSGHCTRPAGGIKGPPTGSHTGDAMIRRLVDFALENRFLVLAAAILLFAWGVVSFYRLPVEAYPDVANNYVDVIAQWPGISAEQIEQQVTVPLEIVMNGIPGVAHVRSWSLFGLSTVELVFGEETTDFENRERVLERLSQVTLPPGVVPQIGTDWSPVGQIYFYTLQSTNPEYDVMNVKSLEDWVVDKNLKSVPGVVDNSPFGGPTREYQVRLDPDKLVSYGLSIAQVEQQLTNNNANAGGSFIEAGQQQINIREVGLVRNIQDIENTVVMTKAGTALRMKDIAVVTQGPKIRLGQFARAYHREDGKIIDNDDVVSGIVALQKGADAQPVLEGIHKKVQELNDHILPEGVKLVPFIDRSDLLHFTTHTVLHNLTEGIILVVIILFLFLGNVRGAIIVALTIPFSLLFASICLDLKHIPANLLSLGALDFGMVVDGSVVMVENIVRHLSHHRDDTVTPAEKIREAAHEVQRPVFYAIGIIITAYLPIFTLQAVEGRLFRPMAWTVAFALLGALIFSMIVAPVLASFLFRKGAREWTNPVMTFLTVRYRKAVTWAIRQRVHHGRRWRRRSRYRDLSRLRWRHRLRIPSASG